MRATETALGFCMPLQAPSMPPWLRCRGDCAFRLIYLCLTQKRDPHFLPSPPSSQITALLCVNRPSSLSTSWRLELEEYWEAKGTKGRRTKGSATSKTQKAVANQSNFRETLMEILTRLSGKLNLARCKASTGFSLHF